MAGYSSTPLLKKLGIKEGSKVLLVDPPGNVDEILEPWTVPAVFDRTPSGEYDVILSFELGCEGMAERIGSLLPHLADRGGLWIAWPKKTSRLSVPGLSENPIREVGLSVGLVDNKVCAVDEDWSGLRFVRRLKTT